MNVQQLHQQGMTLREQDKLEEAASVLSQAIFQAAIEEEYRTLAGAHGDRALVWKHLFLNQPTQIFIRLMDHDVELMLTVAKEHGIKDLETRALFFTGETAMLAANYEEAGKQFKLAVEATSDSAVKGDYMYHWGEAMYRSGQKETGKKVMLKGLHMIQAHEAETDGYEYHVWISGCLIRLADLLRVDEPEVAWDYLDKAKQVIDGDERLMIRKRQWEKLRELF